MYQAWDKFKSLFISCLHYHKDNEVLVHTFIEGLETNTKILLDYVAGEQALEKTYEVFFTLLNRISWVNTEWNGGGSRAVVQKTVGMLNVDGLTTIAAQLVAMQNPVNTHFSNMNLGQQTGCSE